MKAYERLLKYIAIRTPSDEESDTVPSSTCQFELAQHLHRELFTMGITDVKVDMKTGRNWDSSLTWTRFLISATTGSLLRSTRTIMGGICPSAQAAACCRRICSPT